MRAVPELQVDTLSRTVVDLILKSNFKQHLDSSQLVLVAKHLGTGRMVALDGAALRPSPARRLMLSGQLARLNIGRIHRCQGEPYASYAIV